MKISKARLKQIIKEELEAVVNEEEEEVTENTETEDEAVEESFISRAATAGPERRVPASVQRTRQRNAQADRAAMSDSSTPTLDAAADALGMTPSQLMMDLAREMGAIPAEDGEPPLDMPEGE